MSLDKILITIVGVLLAVFIQWFFLFKKRREIKVAESVDIIVDGGYTPDTIEVHRGNKVTINFLRKDPSSCLEEVVMADFKVKKFLPLNEKVAIEITPEKVGEFPFQCSMNMYHGKIIVV